MTRICLRLLQIRHICVIALMLLTAWVCAAQVQIPPTAAPPDTGPPGSVWQQEREKEMQKKLNAQRQDEIRKDTEKLLELATELKQSVDKSSANTLSVDVVKKAEQIEKLAKAVKEKMKGP